jgi:hypothetical protein
MGCATTGDGRHDRLSRLRQARLCRRGQAWLPGMARCARGACPPRLLNPGARGRAQTIGQIDLIALDFLQNLNHAGKHHDVQADHRDGGKRTKTAGTSRTAPRLRDRPVHRGRRGHGDGHLPVGACTGIYESRVAAHGPNGGGSTRTAPHVPDWAQAPSVPACAAGTAGDLCGPLSMPVSMQVTPSSASGLPNGHDVRADHRDDGGMTRGRPGLREPRLRLRVRREHQGRRGRSLDHHHGRPGPTRSAC